MVTIDFKHTEEWFYFRITIWWSGTIIHLVLILHEIIENCMFHSRKQKKTKHKSTSQKTKLVLIIPLFMYISFFLAGLSAILDDMEWTSISCLTYSRLGIIAWFFGKCFMYQVFILRLDAAYRKSQYKYSDTFLIIFSTLIVLETIAFSIWIYIYTTTETVYYGNVRICTPHMSLIVLGLGLIIDQIVSFTTLILFLKPMTTLMLEMSTTNNKTQQNMKLLIHKYSTLTMVAVLTTFVHTIITGTFDIAVTAMIDMVINSLCVALLNGWNQTKFSKCCCLAVPIVSKLASCCQICGPKMSNEDKKKIKNEFLKTQKTVTNLNNEDEFIESTTNTVQRNEGNIGQQSPIDHDTVEMENAQNQTDTKIEFHM
eukprot:429057_1